MIYFFKREGVRQWPS